MIRGAVSGIAGGLVFGLIMAQIGFLPTVAAIVRTDSVVLGFAVHMLFAMIIGAGFGLLVERQRAQAGELLFWGLVYGAFWWFLGPLTLLPILLGRPVTWDLTSGQSLTPSLFGHLAYGAFTAAAYAWRQAPSAPIRLATVVRGAVAALVSAAVLVLGLNVMTGRTPYELLVAAPFAGAAYALLFGGRSEGTGPALIRGMVYGFAWWILLALTLPGLLDGGRLDWSIAMVRETLPALPGYLLLGAGTGAVFTWLGGLALVLFADDVRRLQPDPLGVPRLTAAAYGVALGLVAGLLGALAAGPLGLVEGVVAGVTYALFFRGRSFDSVSGLGWGLSYGFLWWLLGPLILLPVLRGAHPSPDLAAAFPALVAHLVAGAAVGVLYNRLEERANPWWLTRGQSAAERANALREQTLGSAPAIWTLVLLLAVLVPTLVAT
ncbi:hypothetical protein ACFFR3_32730 [Nonomuraea salmonea]|uniref:Uncharacterized protein n=1 Tax=Nonomuraea salmonea TaxID=46181 RepID=A0ABV5NVB7_9ACTN